MPPPLSLSFLVVACELLLGVDGGPSGSTVVDRSAAVLRSAKRYTPPGGWWPLQARGTDCRHCGWSREAHHGTELFCTQSAETLRRQLDFVHKLQAADAFLRRCKNRLRGRSADDVNVNAGAATQDEQHQQRSLQLRGGSVVNYTKWDYVDVRDDTTRERRRRAQEEAQRWDLSRRAEDGDFSSDLREEDAALTHSTTTLGLAHDAGTEDALENAGVREDGCVSTSVAGSGATAGLDGRADAGAAESIGHPVASNGIPDGVDGQKQSTCPGECEDERRGSTLEMDSPRTGSTSQPRANRIAHQSAPLGMSAPLLKGDSEEESGGCGGDADWSRAEDHRGQVSMIDEDEKPAVAAGTVIYKEGQEGECADDADGSYDVSCGGVGDGGGERQRPCVASSSAPRAGAPSVTLANQALAHATVSSTKHEVAVACLAGWPGQPLLGVWLQLWLQL